MITLDGIRNPRMEPMAKVMARAAVAWMELFLHAGGVTTRPDPDTVFALSEVAIKRADVLRALAAELGEDARTLRARASAERLS